MITADNVTLTPPLSYIHGTIKNEEVTELMNNITDFFSQTNVIYMADLTVSCNEWETVKNKFGENIGKKRKDITFTLNTLKRLDVYEDCLVFTLIDDTVHKIKVNKRFFWFFDWERAYYD